MVVQSTRRVSSTRKRKKATRHSSTRPTHFFFLFNLLVLALEYSNSDFVTLRLFVGFVESVVGYTLLLLIVFETKKDDEKIA